jgi:hypothetical protein
MASKRLLRRPALVRVQRIVLSFRSGEGNTTDEERKQLGLRPDVKLAVYILAVNLDRAFGRR